jgi:hypothetical protein
LKPTVTPSSIMQEFIVQKGSIETLFPIVIEEGMP